MRAQLERAHFRDTVMILARNREPILNPRVQRFVGAMVRLKQKKTLGRWRLLYTRRLK